MNYFTYKNYVPINLAQTVVFRCVGRDISFSTINQLNAIVWNLDNEKEAIYVFNELLSNTIAIPPFKE